MADSVILLSLTEPLVASAQYSSLVADSPVAADGVAASSISVTVKDQNDDALAGALVELFATGPARVITQPAGVSDGVSPVVGSIKSTVPGTCTVFAVVDDIVIAVGAVQFVGAGGVLPTIASALLALNHFTSTLATNMADADDLDSFVTSGTDWTYPVAGGLNTIDPTQSTYAFDPLVDQYRHLNLSHVLCLSDGTLLVEDHVDTPGAGRSYAMTAGQTYALKRRMNKGLKVRATTGSFEIFHKPGLRA